MRRTNKATVGGFACKSKTMKKQNMIIDFHTHAFPDKIAAGAVDSLGKAANFEALTDGTVSNLQNLLAESEIDLGVILPVATRPDQFYSINRFAAEVCERDRVISFGSVHPFDEAFTEHIKEISRLGLKGIKLHPDFQGAYIDDECFVRLVYAAFDAGLIVVTHAGIDPGLHGGDVHCTPKRAANLLDKLAVGEGEVPFVFAHGGGYAMHKEAMKHLTGRKIYVDLSMMHRMSDVDSVTELVRAHGAERVLLGSDCPWGHPIETLDFIRNLQISDEEKTAILGENAKRLLKI